MQQHQYELSDPPSDAISSVVFSPIHLNYLIVSSWDKVSKIDIYKIYLFLKRKRRILIFFF
jgi:hypothetical protein